MAVLDAKGREKVNAEAKLVDASGDQTGTNLNPLVTEEVDTDPIEKLVVQLRITNFYLAIITGEKITEDDVQFEDDD